MKPEFVCLTRARLSSNDQMRLAEIAGEKEIEFRDLAAEELALFAPAGNTLRIIAIPTAGALDVSADSLQDTLAPLINQTVGAVILLDDIIPGVPADSYIVSVDPVQEQLSLIGAEASFPFKQAVVRRLDLELSRPRALISRSEICFAWDTTQVCGQVDLAVPEGELRAISDAIRALQVEPEAIDVSQTIPLIGGEEQQLACARGFASEQPDYSGCQASVLAAPALSDEALERRLGPDIVGLGVVQVLQPLREEVHAEPRRDTLLIELPEGSYLAYALPAQGEAEPSVDGLAIWVALYDGERTFYLPAIEGGQLLGENDAFPRPAAAVATSLILRDRCFFSASFCPRNELP